MRVELTRKILSKILVASLLFLNFLFVGVPVSHAAAFLYVSPNSKTVNNGEEFQIQVRVNVIDGDTTNGVAAVVSYPIDKLDVLRLDYTGTSFPIEAKSTFGGGLVNMQRATNAGDPPVANDVLIGTIVFKAKVGSGSATVNFVDASSHVVRATDNVEILSGTTPGTYTFNTPVNPPTLDFKVNGSYGPITVNSGASVTLSWTSSNATSCTASGDWAGGKPTNGSEQIGNITSNKTFTLSCSGPGGGPVTKSVQVNVANSPPRPTVSISAKPSSIKSGETSTLSWSSSNATSVSITPGIGTVGTSGSKQVKPTASITYTAVATGPGGTSSPAYASIVVDNKPAPPPPPPPADTTACKITSVKVTGASLKSVTIEWKTDEPSTGLVEYGFTANKYNFRSESPELKKDHKVTLPISALAIATIHHYQIKCTDAAGNSGVTKDATFKTKGYLVKIKVINQETGNPVPGAFVSLALSSGVVSAESDKEGIATFEDIAAGEYLVTAKAGGYPSDLKIKVKEATKEEIASGKLPPQIFEIKVAVVQAAVWQKVLPAAIGGGLLLVIVAAIFWLKTRRILKQKGGGGGGPSSPQAPSEGVKEEAKEKVVSQEEAGEGVEEFYKPLGPKEGKPSNPEVPPTKKERPPKMEVFRA